MSYTFGFMRPLSKKQIEALKILVRHRDRPVWDLQTSEKAINDTTAWALEDRQLASTTYISSKSETRIKILPQARQLLKESL